jgi:hypothetical protein
MLFPVSLDSKIAQDSPVRLVNQVVDNLDISKVIDTYKGGGTSAYPPRVMLKLVIFAYLSNIYSSRKIEAAILDRFSNDIEPFVKFPYFHKEQKRALKNNAFLAQNLFYNKEKDFFVCPIGQRMEKVGEATRKTDRGFISFVSHYEAKNCEGCPLKCLCHNAKGNRRIEVNHNLNRRKEKARQLLTSQEGLYHHRQRSIEPESVFGQIKSNKNYFRFRHFGKELISMDFAIFAIAFNIGKLYNKGKITPKNGLKPPVLSEIIVFAVVFYEKYKIPLQQENYYTQNLKLAA